MQFKLDQTVQHKPSQKKLVVISNDFLTINGDDYVICRDENYSIDKYKLNEIEMFSDNENDIKLKIRYSDYLGEKYGQKYTMGIFGELDDYTDITSAFKAGMKKQVELIEKQFEGVKFSDL